MCFLRGYLKDSREGICCPLVSRSGLQVNISHILFSTLAEAGRASSRKHIPLQYKVLGTRSKDVYVAFFLNLLTSLYCVYFLLLFLKIITDMLKHPWDCKFLKIWIKGWWDLRAASNKRNTCYKEENEFTFELISLPWLGFVLMSAFIIPKAEVLFI